MKNISVIAVVYNEGHRIETFLKSFSWSDDVIVVDKSSTDNTREIALKYTENVILVPYSDTGDEIKYGLAQAKNDWILTVTASDLIHPKLVKKIIKLINTKDFDFEVISLPFAIYVFGIRNPKRSPWGLVNKEWLIKKEVLSPSKEVHKEMEHNSKKIFKMGFSETENLYHLTHESMETFLERHTRYTRCEALKYNDEKTAFRSSLKELLRSVYEVFIKKRSFLLGWDGLALGLAYISYFIFKYLFIWEKFRGKGSTEYSKIKQDIIKLWEDESKIK